MTENELSSHIVKSALAVHRELGPGFLEGVYEKALFYELRSCEIDVHRQQHVPVFYKGVSLDMAYRLDLLVEEKVIIEVKAVAELHDLHLAQILTYLRLTGNKLGMLINFNVPLIKDGIKRVVNGL
jgi:GxxExxY protein